ncbi:MAG TPA: hypothetical protein PK205_07240 [Promineifilum sp.]|nr:hypothetical protein [Promineifilum sp.]
MARAPRFGPHRYEYELGRRNYNVVIGVTEFVAETKQRIAGVVRQSVQDVFDIASTDVGKGGKMRVDTGFLRASGKISLTGMPTGPGRGERTEPNSYPYNRDIAVAELKNFKTGQSIFTGWTANYAKYREAYDGFLWSALQNWSQIVADNCRKLQGRIEARRAREMRAGTNTGRGPII